MTNNYFVTNSFGPGGNIQANKTWTNCNMARFYEMIAQHSDAMCEYFLGVRFNFLDLKILSFEPNPSYFESNPLIFSARPMEIHARKVEVVARDFVSTEIVTDNTLIQMLQETSLNIFIYNHLIIQSKTS